MEENKYARISMCQNYPSFFVKAGTKSTINSRKEKP